MFVGRSILRLFLRVFIFAGIFVPVILYCLYEVDTDVAFHRKGYHERSVDPRPALSGCFKPERISPDYNMTERRYTPKMNSFQTGMSITLDLDCFRFAGTINLTQPVDYMTADRPMLYHTYWAAGSGPLGAMQDLALKAFFATQNLQKSRLILWSEHDISNDTIAREYLEAHPSSFTTQVLQINGTSSEFAGLDLKQKDLIPLFILWNQGGIWMDMNLLLTRDLSPLVEHEFVTEWTEWGCKGPDKQPTLIFMRFFKHSPYICEMFHSRAARPSEKWTDTLSLLWFSLVAEDLPPFEILPYCFIGGQRCRRPATLPDPFVVSPKWNTRNDTSEWEHLRTVFGLYIRDIKRLSALEKWINRLIADRYEKY